MKRIRIRFFLSLLLMLLISGIFVSYAWLLSGWNSGHSVWDFSVGTLPPPTATMWLYSTELEESNSEALGWVEHSLTGDAQDSHAFRMPGAESLEQEGAYIFEIKSLQLGTVDNLVIMNQDNIVCLRFTFDSAVHGNSAATLTADLSDTLGQSFQLYDSHGYKVTDDSLNRELLTIQEQMTFLQYQACISAQNLSPSDAAFEELPFSEVTMFGTPLDLYDGGNQPIEGEYYVYIKIMPNLSSFAPASELLNAYMPCVILFDTEIQLTVH